MSDISVFVIYDGGWVLERLILWLEDWDFIVIWFLGRGRRKLEIEFNFLVNDLINYIYLIKVLDIKNRFLYILLVE